MRRLIAFASGAALIVTLEGCLFRTAEAPRFYRPASAALDGGAAPAASDVVTGDGAPIRLHAVRSAPFLRERMVWRASDVEYGLYEQRRWFELPTRYVRRALVRTLQNTGGVRLVDDVSAPRLDVEVLAFDEIVAPKHEASVVLAVTVRDGDRIRLDHIYASRIAIASADAAATAQAMGRALDEVANDVADGVAAAIRAKTAAGGTRRPHAN